MGSCLCQQTFWLQGKRGASCLLGTLLDIIVPSIYAPCQAMIWADGRAAGGASVSISNNLSNQTLTTQ